MGTLQLIIILILSMFSFFLVWHHFILYFHDGVDDDYRTAIGLGTFVTIFGWLIVWAFV